MNAERMFLLFVVVLAACAPSAAGEAAAPAAQEKPEKIAAPTAEETPGQTAPTAVPLAEQAAFAPADAEPASATPASVAAATATPTSVEAASPTPASAEHVDFDVVAWRSRVDAAFEPADCPTREKVELRAGSYSGPLIDSHFHMPQLPDTPPGAEPGESELPGFAESRYADWEFDVDDDPIRAQQPLIGRNTSVTQLTCVLDQDGTESYFAFFPILPSAPEPHLDLAGATVLEHERLFVPFIMPPGSHDIPPTVGGDELEAMLDYLPGVFSGYGEIGIYDIPGRSAADFPPDAEIFLEIYEVVARHGLLVYLHPGEGQVENFDRVLGLYPELTFIVHGDEIEDDIEYLMQRHDNIYYTVDAIYGDQYLLRPEETVERFLAATADYQTLLQADWAKWRDLIEKHPDRFMWGTDRGGNAAWTYELDVALRLVDYGRAFIGGLDPSVQQRFAYENAAGLAERAAG